MTAEPNEMNVLADTLTDAVRAAVGSGDLTEVHQLLARLTDEDPHGQSWDWMLAVVLLRLRAEAEQQGRPGLAAEYSRMAEAECGPEIVTGIAITSLLVLDGRRGWLRAAEYDQAAAIGEAAFPDLVAELRKLPRHEA